MCNLGTTVGLFIGIAAFVEPAMAIEVCPVDDAAIEKSGGYGNAVEAIITAAPYCEQAYKLHAACLLNSSGDNSLAEIVQSKCELLFMNKASPAMKKAYKKKLDSCNRTATQNAGSMYQGWAAVCRSKAARVFSRKLL